MPSYDVMLDVSAIDESVWFDWCELPPVDGIEYLAVQDDGLEHWRVRAPSAELARELAETAIGDWAATIVSVTERKAGNPRSSQWYSTTQERRTRKQFMVTLPEPLIERVNERASEDGSSKSGVVESALEAYLGKSS